jgi:hypothetical protein
MDTPLNLFLKILSAYALFLTVVGTFLNSISIFVCIRLRANKSFVFLSFLCVSDTIALYFWNLNHFTSGFFHINLIAINYWLCKFGQFVQFSSMQISAWLLVFIFIRLKFIFWKSIPNCFLFLGCTFVGSFFDNKIPKRVRFEI